MSCLSVMSTIVLT